MGETQTQYERSRTGGIIRRLTAIVCVLWLGGLGCLVGCGPMVFATTPAPVALENHETAESCPMASMGGDCCRHAKTERRGAAGETLSSTPQQMNCCPLAGQTADHVRKLRFVEAPVAVVARESLSAPAFVSHAAAAIPGRRRVPDRGSTYLRCCVFLI
ncbi:MAG: hypothetical protein LC754_02945 [Acidobacteria bacterium]|nr:hypothetical protein [Acidobacteriota bacterium]